MNHYEAKQEAKRERLEQAAERAQRESDSRHHAANAAIDGIPPGQPILVGHHSEKRHRRALERHDANMRKAIDAEAKAQHYRGRAASVGTGGISSDDPEAVDKLQAKLDALRATHAERKRINAAWTKCRKPVPNDPEGWAKVAAALGVELPSLYPIRMDMARIWEWHKGPPYSLTHSNSEIRRLEGRINALDAADGLEYTETRHPCGALVVEDPGINRVQISFSSRPSKDTCSMLKQAGFRWSRENQAWQRHLVSQGAGWSGPTAAKYVLERIAASSDAGRLREGDA